MSESQSEKKIGLAKSAQEFTRQILYHKENLLLDDCDSKKFTIYHFNDVYNIESGKLEPKAGAARFLTALNYLNIESPGFVLFSGDALSPSLSFFFFIY